MSMDDEREIAEKRWPVLVTGYADSDGSRFEYESPENRKLREAYLDGVTTGLRRQGPITDTQVKDALIAYYSTNGAWVSDKDHWINEFVPNMRAALEAARDAE